jgi:hypothetical protein
MQTLLLAASKLQEFSVRGGFARTDGAGTQRPLGDEQRRFTRSTEDQETTTHTLLFECGRQFRIRASLD